MNYFRILYLLSSLLFTACASQKLIKDVDYQPSLALYKQSEFKLALEKFPQNENRGFITSIEKAWLTLWNHEGDNSQLEKQIHSLDERKYTSLLRESEYFFVNESEDGYVPAEHEIICLHLINAMIYMQKQQWSEAEVEARRASYFLQNIFDPNQPHFDDPALRLWLAAVWLNLGEWSEAQVDLRKIQEIAPHPKIAELLKLTQAPTSFRLIFKGSGPQLEWQEANRTPRFALPSTELVSKSSFSFSSQPWYDRHVHRNTVLRDVVTESHYMSQYLQIKTNKNSQLAAGYTLGTTSKVIGVAVGAAIIGGGIYLLSQSNATGSGEAIGSIFGAGLFAGGWLWQSGQSLIQQTEADAKKYENSEFEKLRTYRYVRFLPSFISFEKNKDFTQSQNLIYNELTFKNPKSTSQVQFILAPL